MSSISHSRIYESNKLQLYGILTTKVSVRYKTVMWCGRVCSNMRRLVVYCVPSLHRWVVDSDHNQQWCVHAYACSFTSELSLHSCRLEHVLTPVLHVSQSIMNTLMKSATGNELKRRYYDGICDELNRKERIATNYRTCLIHHTVATHR